MLTFHVITLFPELIGTYCQTSIIGRGIKSERISVVSYNPRDFCADKYRKVDDTPYGGGVGMVLKPEPIFAALESINVAGGSPICLLSPQGRTFDQQKAVSLALSEDIILICGHYEGFDERISSATTEQISIGDFVVTGGELAALVVIDAVSRLVPGVLGKLDSAVEESFTTGLLEAPQYTKPAEFRGMVVPDILLSGDHKKIARWRREQSLQRTFELRPDLLETADLDKADKRFIDSLKTEDE